MVEVTEKAINKLVELMGEDRRPVRLEQIMSGCG